MKPQELKAYLGQEVALSEWILVDQARIDAFAHATGDHQFIHTDAEKAAAGPFGTTIAHGFLTLALLAGEFMTHGGAVQIEGAQMTVNYGLNRVRFISPVKVDSRLRNRAVLQSAEQGAGYLQITVLNTIEIEGEQRPAATAESVFRVYLMNETSSEVKKDTSDGLCKCGCGMNVRSGRVFVNKEHQLNWMNSGGASELNALMPDEARVDGGRISGARSRDSGLLAEAAKKGGKISSEIAESVRRKRESKD